MNRKKLVLSMLVGLAVFAFSAVAFAQTADATAMGVAKLDMNKWFAIAAPFPVGAQRATWSCGQDRGSRGRPCVGADARPNP